METDFRKKTSTYIKKEPEFRENTIYLEERNWFLERRK
jgi:hypothetical protein